MDLDTSRFLDFDPDLRVEYFGQLVHQVNLKDGPYFKKNHTVLNKT